MILKDRVQNVEAFPRPQIPENWLNGSVTSIDDSKTSENVGRLAEASVTPNPVAVSIVNWPVNVNFEEQRSSTPTPLLSSAALDTATSTIELPSLALYSSAATSVVPEVSFSIEEATGAPILSTGTTTQPTDAVLSSSSDIVIPGATIESIASSSVSVTSEIPVQTALPSSLSSEIPTSTAEIAETEARLGELHTPEPSATASPSTEVEEPVTELVTEVATITVPEAEAGTGTSSTLPSSPVITILPGGLISTVGTESSSTTTSPSVSIATTPSAEDAIAFNSLPDALINTSRTRVASSLATFSTFTPADPAVTEVSIVAPEDISSVLEVVPTTSEAISTVPEVASVAAQVPSAGSQVASAAPEVASVATEVVSAAPEAVSAAPEVVSAAPELVNTATEVANTNPDDAITISSIVEITETISPTSVIQLSTEIDTPASIIFSFNAAQLSSSATVTSSFLTVEPSTSAIVPLESAAVPVSSATAPFSSDISLSSSAIVAIEPLTTALSGVVERTRTVTTTVSLSIVTTVTTTSFSVVLSIPPTIQPGTTGTVLTTLEPIHSTPESPSVISQPQTTLQPTTTSTATVTISTEPVSDNIFGVAIATDAPFLPSRGNHPVPRTGISLTNTNGLRKRLTYGNGTSPISTNKFYGNLFLGTQDMSVWTHPYSLQWSNGGGNLASWGMAISHTDRSQTVFGEGSPPRYFINPLGIQSIILSAVELGASTVLTTDSLEDLSTNVNLAPSAGQSPVLTLPLVQGMGFVTGVYHNAAPVIQSGVLFRSVSSAGTVNNGATMKYRILLQDGKTWLMYCTPSEGSHMPNMTISSGALTGASGFHGAIQVAKQPGNSSAEDIYDRSAGTYAVSGKVSGTSSGSYSLSWTRSGLNSSELLMFALPHHIQSFDDKTSKKTTALQLQTTTKGTATAVLGTSWTMVEQLPSEIGFAPWSPNSTVAAFSESLMSTIDSVASTELAEDFDAQTNLDSMYFSGKGLAKFASIVYVAHNITENVGLATAGLLKLKDAFGVFINNTQKTSLAYDTTWGGIVSTDGYSDLLADFGNTIYNDHHFHYGYFVYTASVIATLDPSWLLQGSNKAWVNLLVRDFANPSDKDTYFPVSRAFDWYHGHSWAKGLAESGDGKDQESTSEDSFASFAIKMWGRAIKDENMEARGNLMLAVQARSFQNYFLMESTNVNQPAEFIGNKVTGILFENKCDHATYFGTNTEYIQGIHMLPIAPQTGLIRTHNFVQEEWDTYFSGGRVDQINSGWKGIIYANLALIDPKTSFDFFNQPNFDPTWLDGGASRTWYLTYAAVLGGAA